MNRRATRCLLVPALVLSAAACATRPTVKEEPLPKKRGPDVAYSAHRRLANVPRHDPSPAARTPLTIEELVASAHGVAGVAVPSR